MMHASDLLLLGFQLVVFAADLAQIDCWFRKLNAEFLHGVRNNLRDYQIAEPFVIGRNYEPRRMVRTAFRKRVLISALIGIPVFSFRVIRFADLPLPSGIFQSLFEALQLLFFADVQEELQNMRAARHKPSFEVVNFVVSLGPDALGLQIVYSYHQHTLILRAIENDDFAAPRRLAFDAPQKIMSQLLRRWLLESYDPASLRIHGADHVSHHAIFPACIRSLKTNQ